MSPSEDLPMAGNVSPPLPTCAGKVHVSLKQVRVPIIAVLAVFSSLALTGCFLDFEQFDERSAPISDGGEVGSDVQPDSNLPDGDTADDGVDGTTDTGTPQVTIGAQCSANSDCGAEGICTSGYCTRECASDSDCPGASSCHAFGEQTLCLADCDVEQSCAGVAGRDDLSCVILLEQAPSDAVSIGGLAEQRRVCMSDEDDDSVADALDNCPSMANARQSDRDGDGDGDDCDDEPLCHSQAQDGLIDYGTFTYEPTDFSLPQSTAMNWLPIVGGVDAQGNDVASMAVVDRSSASWVDAADLPYAAGGRLVAPTSANRYLVTPGVLEDGQPELGSYLLVGRDGTVRFGPEYSSDLYDTILGSTGLDVLMAHGYTTDSNAFSNPWRVERYNTQSGQFELVESGSDAERVQWHSTVDMRGNFIFYSKVQPTINVMRLLQYSPTGDLLQSRNLSLPARQPPATGQFDPFLVPGPGNVMYVFDRAVGAAIRIDMQSLAVTEIGEFDLDFGTSDAQFVSVPGAPSFIAIDRSSDDPTQLNAREFFLPCLPGTSTRDQDGDGVGDIVDNCPTADNANQNDADADTVGDICDLDSDDDGVPDTDDTVLADDGVTVVSLALDTDNDGTDNTADDDDDNDGIPDTRDRRPLDTDNDGLDNGVDGDDDNDGYSDASEATSATNPLAALSFPGAGVVSWVRRDATTRSLEFAPVSDVDDLTTLPVDGATAPHRPRFVAGGAHIFALGGEPGTATGVLLVSTDPNAGTPVQTFEAGVALRGADPAEAGLSAGVLSSIIAAYPGDQTNTWQIGQINVTDQSKSPLVTMFGDVRSPRVGPGTIAFVGAPTNCAPCLTPYVVANTGGPLQTITSRIENPQKLRTNAGTFLVVGQASDGEGTSGYVVNGTGNLSRPGVTERRPPGISEVDSFERFGADGHILLSGRTDANSSYGLWLYNARTTQWHLIHSSDADLVEVDWVASVPALAEPMGSNEPL
jgi:hypothetical protein